jgi:hypothetical protein
MAGASQARLDGGMKGPELAVYQAISAGLG